jgi:hypothetical protein
LIENGDNDIDMIDLATNTVESGNFATASVYGFKKQRKAIYREGLGYSDRQRF